MLMCQHTQTIASSFVKRGQWGALVDEIFVYATPKAERSGSKHLFAPFPPPHFPIFIIMMHFYTSYFTRCKKRQKKKTVFVKRGAVGALFSSRQSSLQFVQKVPPLPSSVKKSICFSHLHSRIDFPYLYGNVWRTWHSEAFYNIFIRSCGPKVQRFEVTLLTCTWLRDRC